MPNTPAHRVAIVGGGPAGLAAAEILLEAGIPVDLYEAMPSVGRKFLMAGKGGMNITHSEALPDFLSRYAERSETMAPIIRAFDPTALREWIHGLGVETFVGSSGRVFPREMKAAPLLRSWLHRLRQKGLRLHVRHRWVGWGTDGALHFRTPAGEVSSVADACILALGGGSWAKLGSDGAWVEIMERRNVAISPLKASNCGFNIAWTPHLKERFAGLPVKGIAAWTHSSAVRKGECLITQNGIEGGVIYALSSMLRDAIDQDGSAILYLDLLPQSDLASIIQALQRPRGRRSLSSHLQSQLGLGGVKAGLLREILSPIAMNDSPTLAATIKALPLRLLSPRPLDEAISSAGGVCFEALDSGLMLTQCPGTFCAGEMLDWEAPTGGYLLTACLATGRHAGASALAWLRRST